MRKPGHLLWGGNEVLVIEDGINDINTRAILDEEYDELALGRGDWEDLAFLATVAHKVTRLSVLAYKCDLDSISHLKYLRYLRLDDAVKPIFKARKFDFSFFCDLEEVRMMWQSFYSPNFLDLPKLRSLSIWKFPHATLEEIGRARNLRFLDLSQSPTASLAGLESLANLEELKLFSLAKLEDIEALRGNASIKSLSIQKCPKIADLSSISAMRGLECFYLTSKNALPDLGLVAPLAHLRELIFTCEIVVQDFKPLFALKDLRLARFIALQNFTATDDELLEMARQAGRTLKIEVSGRGREEQTVTFLLS